MAQKLIFLIPKEWLVHQDTSKESAILLRSGITELQKGAKRTIKFHSQLNTSGREPMTSDTPVSHSIDIPTEELKILRSLEPHSFLPQYPLRLASTSTKQPTSYTHTWTDTLIMKYQRRNSATRGQSSHNVYTRALNEILFTTEHVWARRSRKDYKNERIG